MGGLAYLSNFVHIKGYHIHFYGTDLFPFHIDPISFTLTAENYFSSDFENKVAGFPQQKKCLCISPQLLFFSVSFGVFIEYVFLHLVFGRLGCVIYDVANIFWPHSIWSRRSYCKQKRWLSTAKIILSKKIEINLKARVIALFRHCCVRVFSKQLYHQMVAWLQVHYFLANVVFPSSLSYLPCQQWYPQRQDGLFALTVPAGRLGMWIQETAELVTACWHQRVISLSLLPRLWHLPVCMESWSSSLT